MENLMNKLAIPAILAATVMVAGMFAFMPVEQASTVHATGFTNISTAATIISAKLVDTNSFTAGNTGAERHLIMFESDVAYTISDIEVKGTLAAALDSSNERIRLSTIEAASIEYARTTNGISDLTGDNNQVDIYGEGSETVVEGDETFDSMILGAASLAVETEDKAMTFGPNTFVIVELKMQKQNTGDNVGDMEAIVTFYVTGATPDNITITELQDTSRVFTD